MSVVTIRGGVYEGGESKTSGGAFYLDFAKTFRINGTRLHDNVARVSGGARLVAVVVSSSSSVRRPSVRLTPICCLPSEMRYSYVLSTSAHVSDCQFDGNTAANGGAMFFANAPAVVATRTRFSNNFAREGGGALYLSSSDLSISATNFVRNSASLEGGSLHLAQASTVVLADSNATSSIASCGGSAYLTTNSSITVQNTHFNGNTARSGCGGQNNANLQGGGALHLADNAALVCRECGLANNVADGQSNGGAISLTSSSAFLSLTTFRGNQAIAANGGGVSLKFRSVIILIDSNWFEHNSAGQAATSGHGGGLYLSNSTYINHHDGNPKLRRLATTGGRAENARALLTIDDDDRALWEFEEDLEERYANVFRALSAIHSYSYDFENTLPNASETKIAENGMSAGFQKSAAPENPA